MLQFNLQKYRGLYRFRFVHHSTRLVQAVFECPPLAYIGVTSLPVQLVFLFVSTRPIKIINNKCVLSIRAVLRPGNR